MDTQLRYYLHIDPSVLSDEEWTLAYNQLVHIRNAEKGA